MVFYIIRGFHQGENRARFSTGRRTEGEALDLANYLAHGYKQHGLRYVRVEVLRWPFGEVLFQWPERK